MLSSKVTYSYSFQKANQNQRLMEWKHRFIQRGAADRHKVLWAEGSLLLLIAVQYALPAKDVMHLQKRERPRRKSAHFLVMRTWTRNKTYSLIKCADFKYWEHEANCDGCWPQTCKKQYIYISAKRSQITAVCTFSPPTKVFLHIMKAWKELIKLSIWELSIYSLTYFRQVKSR